jgi:hypothetical protein
MDALDWIALVTAHIPNPHEQMVRYYGWYLECLSRKKAPAGRP